VSKDILKFTSTASNMAAFSAPGCLMPTHRGNLQPPTRLQCKLRLPSYSLRATEVVIKMQDSPHKVGGRGGWWKPTHTESHRMSLFVSDCMRSGRVLLWHHPLACGLSLWSLQVWHFGRRHFIFAVAFLFFSFFATRNGVKVNPTLNKTFFIYFDHQNIQPPGM